MAAPASSASALDGLDLITPASLRNADKGDLHNLNLKGYEKLLVIREQTIKFRNDYRNWRKGRAQGAAGESHHVTNLQRHIADPGEKEKSLLPAAPAAGLPSAPPPGADGSSEDWLKFLHNPFSAKGPTQEALPLRAKNLAAVAAMKHGTALPAEGSRTATNFIAHIGVGGFHRSHQAYSVHQLMQMAAAPGSGVVDADKWGIIGVGLMPWDRKMHDVLTEQDYMYTLLMRSKQGSDSCVVGSILDFLFVPDDPDGSLATLCQPSTRIISLTVTEKGYYRNVSGALDTTQPLIQEDAAAWGGPDVGIPAPKTAFGLIATVLCRRRAAGTPPVTVMSCDNLPMNGDTVASCMFDFFALVQPDLVDWVKANVSFPNSMVDRITPATEDKHRALISNEFGITDGWPVVAEPFLQWVIEDNFVNGRPSFEKVEGVLFTDHVKPYEFMKLRLLNSTHSALSYVAYLAGHRFVDDAMADCDVANFTRCYMREVVATVPQVPGIDLDDYQETLMARFGNPYIKDKITRLCEDGSQKFQNTLLEALHEMLHDGPQPPPVPKMVALALAGYMRFMAGTDEGRDAIEIKDPLEATLKPLAQGALGGDAAAAAQFIRELLGEEIAAWTDFVDGVWVQYQALLRSGTKTILGEHRLEAFDKLDEEIELMKRKLRRMQKERLMLMPRAARERMFSGVYAD
mmetsp:Transcript_43563/g.136639  ORF Transcript_43563/g.136639 Transcript_43563/m.136639 type:complete len:687 (-) Transcript_43563:2147-4207(-)|eukprot:CAMPEP_0118859216 /NCGR_PEP_ID=MMETSP1163-20130328/5560_1 /TAXON_ID=124430 /ORGANISM="Phaeomonas parva, Strain CCMP2877" /LENGTH=686 /DNA_ID=CAMNT_0006792775 /DNA_START=309 /DNA_END=2369 /DNA_ORIENTATION=-